MGASLEVFGAHGGQVLTESTVATWLRNHPDRSWIDLLLANVRLALAGPIADEIFGAPTWRRAKNDTDAQQVEQLRVSLLQINHALDDERLRAETRALLDHRGGDIARIAAELKRRRNLTARIIRCIIREGENFKPRGGYVPPHWAPNRKAPL